jgi:hypothetical protein
MLPRDRTNAIANAPLDDLITILLRQFKRPLATHGVQLSDAEAIVIGKALAAGEDHPQITPIRQAMHAVIHESEGVLAALGLTFEGALDTDMAELGGWETTAEFLELAERKTNAEVRIAAGAALLAALGDAGYAALIVTLNARDAHDTDAMFGRRTLSHLAQLDAQAKDWLGQARAWLDGQS